MFLKKKFYQQKTHNNAWQAKNNTTVLRLPYVFFIAAFSLLSSCMQESPSTENTLQQSESNGYTYQYVPNDPLNVRIYTLPNGLKVYLSRYQASPRIYTSIAVNAGGKNDPAENTGLAHYLEHIMFKGTADFGTNNWEAERVLLDSIEGLYNSYRARTDTEERRAIYAQIDQVSNDASAYAIPNEYDKMVSFIGATGTNAYTSNDRTVYINDIPANQLESFLRIERNRFGRITPRLFHTELEAVYEEKNRSLDSDEWRSYERLLELAFPNHPYGTQTVIGTVDHLQNPSITEIRNFFDTYYRPNNVSICLSGDLAYDSTIALIDSLFGDWEPNEALPSLAVAAADPIAQTVEDTITGPDPESVRIGFRVGGRGSEDYRKTLLIDLILSNTQAGLIDLNLSQAQRVLSPYSRIFENNDYSLLLLGGSPREGQTLEEVRDLLLEQLELVKQGEFEEWLLEAIVNNLKKERIQQYEQNEGRVDFLVEVATTPNLSWDEYVGEIEAIASYTKAEIVAFAQAHFQDNAIIIYKRHGEANNPKVDKPQITPVQLNRDEQSAFCEQIINHSVEPIVPVFLDYTTDITRYSTSSGIDVHHVSNNENTRFSLYLYSDLGTLHNPALRFAMNYIDYLAPEGLTSDQFKQELYKIGAEIKASSGEERSYIQLTGLQENAEASISLLERLLHNPQSDSTVLAKLVEGAKKERADSEKRKYSIFSNLMRYALYGTDALKNVLTNDELDALTATDLLGEIERLITTEHRILYYGPATQQEVVSLLDTHHEVPSSLAAVPEASRYQALEITSPKVFWVDYDMVQTELLLVGRTELYDPTLDPYITLFNEYFGGSMGSVLFQELREARGLAYSTSALYSQSSQASGYNYFYGYIGSQADKQIEALSGMQELVRTLPLSEQAFSTAQQAIVEKLRAQRIIREDILLDYEAAKRQGLDYDLRRQRYERVQALTLQDIQQFHQERVSQAPLHVLVIGNRDRLNFEALSAYGEVQEISAPTLFGYERAADTQ